MKSRTSWTSTDTQSKSFQIIVEQEDNLSKTIDKVVREARYLARLNHHNIIRYYGAWLEVHDVPISNLPSQGELSNTNLNKKHVNMESKESSFLDCFDEELHNLEVQFVMEHEQDDNLSPAKISRNSLKKQSQSERQIIIKIKKKVIFYIQTELCISNLEEYLQKRNQTLFKIKKKDKSKYLKRLVQIKQDARHIASQILSGLIYIHHECRLIHRDLKPANIFMNSIDQIKLGDFGLVKRLKTHRDDQFTSIATERFLDDEKQISSQMGSAHYSAPEQVDGITQFFDQKTDIYSIGIIIFQLFYPMLTQMELIRNIYDAKQGTLPPEILKEYPSLSQKIIQCLSKDPNQRPDSLELLDCILEQENGELESQSFDAPNNNLRGQNKQLVIQDKINLGYLDLVFEKDHENQKYFCCLDNANFVIYQSERSKKAILLYDLSQCEIESKEELVVIHHSVLNDVFIQKTNANSHFLDLIKNEKIDNELN